MPPTHKPSRVYLLGPPIASYMAKRNRYLYPMGKSRFEPLATIIIASVMATAAIELVSRAIQEIVADDAEPKLANIDLILLGITVVAKIALHFLCRVLPGASMSTLATDHRNDSLSNSVAMFTAWLGSTYAALLPPPPVSDIDVSLGGHVIA
jgi:divalent metal cation (Fe/Co/Zn/Cd) transporter